MRTTPPSKAHHPIILGFATSFVCVLGLGACSNASSTDHDDDPTLQPTDTHDDDHGDDGPAIICEPGEVRCADASTLETCAATGLEWTSSACGAHEECEACFDDACVAACVGPCQQLDGAPSSEGCSFYATNLLRNGSGPDAFVVVNPSSDLAATIDLWFVPSGSNIEERAQGPIELLPGESKVLLLETDSPEVFHSMYRSGFVHHLVSDLPVVAYFHSPFDSSATNASTLLMPEHVMTGDYVIYGTQPSNAPSYFSIIALENQTTVRWWPTVETAGNGVPLPFVESGAMGEQRLNRFDNVRIDSSANHGLPFCAQDLSGTVIAADKPIWVVSAVFVAQVPFCQEADPVDGCKTVIDANCWTGARDFIMEQNIPVDYWGTEYVGPHAPLRGHESHHWRIYAGADDVTVTVDPPQPGAPINLAEQGDWAELVVDPGTNLLFTGDGPFMPVQYVAGSYTSGTDIGAPAMTQMVPTAQYLDRYAFVTGSSYSEHFVQVVRGLDGPDVALDGMAVDGWASLGAWEITTVAIDQGAHTIESAEPFGVLQYGYSGVSGYGYAGGMKAEPLFVP